MGRNKNSTETPGTRGRKSDFSGEKETFLEQFKDDVLNAPTKKEVGAQYTAIVARFIQRYGYDLPFGQNVEGDPEANPPVISEDVDTVEATCRLGIRESLRSVCIPPLRMRYRNKKVHEGSLKKILATMHSMSGAGQRPRRKTAITVYSNMHYDTRFKPEFDKIWAGAKETLPASMRVSMSQDYVRTQWAAETQEYRDSIEEKATAMHVEAMAKWKAGREIEHSAS